MFDLRKALLLKKLFLLLILFLAVFAVSFFYLLEQQMNQPINLSEAKLITVKPGTSLSTFSKNLVKEGWLDNRFWLRSYARLYPLKAKIKTGTFKIEADISLKKLLAQLVLGKEHQFTITFVEGSTFKQWLEQLAIQPNLTHKLSSKSISQIAQLLDINQTNPEGWFFPETYSYTQGTSDLAILKWAYKKMQNTLASQWKTRDLGLPYDNAYQALIMASIIEKETSVFAEQPLISSVFVNRLRKKMRLQTDPTIIYGLGDRYQGDITRAHKREKTAYNTYRINGLPPTPIAMAGLSAIKATLNPATSDYLYFVSDAEGKHVFSKNLAEHNIAVRQYLEKYKKQYGSNKK